VGAPRPNYFPLRPRQVESPHLIYSVCFTCACLEAWQGGKPNWWYDICDLYGFLCRQLQTSQLRSIFFAASRPVSLLVRGLPAMSIYFSVYVATHTAIYSANLNIAALQHLRRSSIPSPTPQGPFSSLVRVFFLPLSIYFSVYAYSASSYSTTFFMLAQKSSSSTSGITSYVIKTLKEFQYIDE
jgi:hypothetical protein